MVRHLLVVRGTKDRRPTGGAYKSSRFGEPKGAGVGVGDKVILYGTATVSTAPRVLASETFDAASDGSPRWRCDRGIRQYLR